MNAAGVIAYAFDADYYCIGCTEELHPGSTQWRAEGFDPANYTDSESNEVHPVFAGDEWWEPSIDSCETLSCSRCGGEIDDVHANTCEDNYGDEPHPVLEVRGVMS